MERALAEIGNFQLIKVIDLVVNKGNEIVLYPLDDLDFKVAVEFKFIDVEGADKNSGSAILWRTEEPILSIKVPAQNDFVSSSSAPQGFARNETHRFALSHWLHFIGTEENYAIKLTILVLQRPV